jgi:pimeloyl-ACP methyl ester carboxylesterase
MALEPFSIPYSEEAVDDLKRRLDRTRWPDAVDAAGWEYGSDVRFIRDICAYWHDQFDWRAAIARMEAFHHFRCTVEGVGVHCIHERGKGPNPMPIVLTHGWPGSFLEMLQIIPLLADPASHGGDPADAFDVVVPSLPGYGFSDRPSQPGVNALRTAQLWIALMRELGYDRFAAQGGDLGASVSTALGLHHAEHVVGVHLNFVPGSYRPFVVDPEHLDQPTQAFLRDVAQWNDRAGAYGHLQRTRPQTPAFGLNDSPAGLAAWIIEKFREWSDCDGDVLRRFSRDELLANVTLYWMTQTIASSFRFYYEGRKAPLELRQGERVEVPCAFARFPREILFPPRTWVERGYNVQRWTDMPRGGHFAAAEEPGMLAADLREFFRPLR